MKTMNEKDKNEMLQAIINEGENYQAKIWGTLMADKKTIIALTAAAGSAAGAFSNEYCYVGVTEKALYFVVVGSLDVSKIKNQFRVGFDEIKQAKVKKSLLPGRRVISMKLEKGELKLSIADNTLGSDLKMQKEGAKYLCDVLNR